MPRPESYRTVERCCATCRFYVYSNTLEVDLCVFGGDTLPRLADGLVDMHGICDEYQPYESAKGREEPT